MYISSWRSQLVTNQTREECPLLAKPYGRSTNSMERAKRKFHQALIAKKGRYRKSTEKHIIDITSNLQHSTVLQIRKQKIRNPKPLEENPQKKVICHLRNNFDQDPN